MTRERRTFHSGPHHDEPERGLLGPRGLAVAAIGLVLVGGALLFLIGPAGDDLGTGPTAVEPTCQSPFRNQWQWSLEDPLPPQDEHLFELTADYGPRCRDGDRLLLGAEGGQLPVPAGPTGPAAYLASPLVLVNLTAAGPALDDPARGERVLLWELAAHGGPYAPIGTGPTVDGAALPAGGCDELVTHRIRATLTQGGTTLAEQTFDLIVDHRCQA